MAKPLKPGQLNPLNFSLKTPIATPDKIIDNPMAVYGQSISNLMNANLFEGVTQFKAQVLLSVDSEEENGGLWQLIRSTLPESLVGSIAPQNKFCICRIPEIHQAFVDPNLYEDGDPKKIKAILRHPVFEVNISRLDKEKSEKLTIGPGSIVNVTFFDALLRTGEVTGVILDSNDPSPLISGGGARAAVENSPLVSEPPSVNQFEIDADARAFDDPTLQNQPLPPISLTFIDSLNPDFQKIIKSFVLRCWEQLAIEIVPTSGYRSGATQREMRRKWEALPKEEQDKTPAPSDGISFHNAGLAFDFNPKVDGTLITSKAPKQEWISSGIGSIISQLGLKWGIDFANNYDPIHVDMSSILGWSAVDVEKFLEASDRLGLQPYSWPVYEYIENPTGQSTVVEGTLTATDSDKVMAAREEASPE